MRLLEQKTRFILMALGLGLVALALAACGGSGTTPTPGAGTTPTASGNNSSSGNKPTIVFAQSDGSFGSEPLESAVAGFIIHTVWGYPTKVTLTSTTAYLATLPNGGEDVLMEGWQQNYPDWYNTNIKAGKIVNLGPDLEGGPQEFIIPEYVHEKYGLNTIEDMASADVAKLFPNPEGSKAAFYNCIVGWSCEKINNAKFRAYGLDKYYDVISPGSAGALKAALVSAQQRQAPVFGYYWEPTALMGEYQWYVLKEPAYSDSCWQELTKGANDSSYTPKEGCAYPNPTLDKLVWSGLKDKAPQAYDFLKKVQMGLHKVEDTMAWAEQNNIQDTTDMKVVAHYIRTYPDTVKSWLTDSQWQQVDQALKAQGY